MEWGRWNGGDGMGENGMGEMGKGLRSRDVSGGVVLTLDGLVCKRDVVVGMVGVEVDVEAAAGYEPQTTV
jgi:hypothetical protein